MENAYPTKVRYYIKNALFKALKFCPDLTYCLETAGLTLLVIINIIGRAAHSLAEGHYIFKIFL